MRTAFPIQIVVGFIMFGAVGCCWVEYRWVNDFEATYKKLSYDLSEPALCYKIAPDAGVCDLFGRISYYRSECFFEAAINTRDEALCSEVVPSQADRCRVAVETEPMKRWGHVGGGNEELLLRLLGYVEPDERLQGLSVVLRLYFDVVGTPEFRERLLLLPDFSAGDDVAFQQLDALAPQCRDPGESIRLCAILRCAVVRDFEGAPGCPPQSAREHWEAGEP